MPSKFKIVCEEGQCHHPRPYNSNPFYVRFDGDDYLGNEDDVLTKPRPATIPDLSPKVLSFLSHYSPNFMSEHFSFDPY